MKGEEFYEWITEAAEERSCSAISEDQCTEVPGNFLKNALSGFCSKLAEQLISPGVTLPWMLSMMQTGLGVSGMLIPLKNLGSLLPQLAVSGRIRSFALRKYFWSIPAFFQALMVLMIGVGFFTLEGQGLGWTIAGLLLLFSMASGVSSVAFKDVMGKTIPKGRRGRLLATRATGGGLLTMLFGFLLYFLLRERARELIVPVLVGAAVVLWVLAGVFFWWIKEYPGATEGGRTPLQEFRKGLRFLKADANLRRFVMARAFLMAIPLAQPFFVIIGREYTVSDLTGLGLFVGASGLAAVISSPFWGIFADRSSRKLMMAIGLFGIVNCLLVLGFMQLGAEWQQLPVFAPLILLNMMAHGGARLSRKTYLTDFAPEQERPLYVALSNTLIGLFTLLTAGIGFVAEWFGYPVLLYFFMGMLLLSIYFAFRLKEV